MTALALRYAVDAVSASCGELSLLSLRSRPVSDQRRRDALNDHVLCEPKPAHDGRGT